MKSTLILKNNGDNQNVEIILQVSYFIKLNETTKVEVQEFTLTVDGTPKEVDFGNSAVEDQEVLVLVQKPKGNIITQKSFILKNIGGQKQTIEFTLNKAIDPETTPDALTEERNPSFVYGRLMDKKGLQNMEDIQIIISAKKDDDSDFVPITSVKTEVQGYFAIEYPIGYFNEAQAIVGLELSENSIPIKLEDKKIIVKNNGREEEKSVLAFPKRLILIAELKENTSQQVDTSDCGCHANEFGNKRVLEEFSFFSLVRTSEPNIKGYVLEDEDEITLADVLNNLPFSIFELIEPIKALPFIVRESPVRTATINITRATRSVANTDSDFLETIKTIKIKKGVLNNFLKDEKAITKDNVAKLFAQNEAYKFQSVLSAKPTKIKPLGRVELGLDNSVDWDDEPTIYQAVEVAHGHLLQFKSEWIADGYSLGDLLYSLPLAPGQKKQIVVFDWDRRESAANVQSIDYEENLFNSLSRDRDILEIAKGTVQENVRGGSSASVKAIGGGIGGFVGVLFGVAGGASKANSSAWQNSLRQTSASDQQKLRDRIVQSANSVRSMRSTVIQTVSQGERFEVSSESVANYNHCHALTIQYYEVLRHFKIRQRFADAREVLFVPLLISQFDLKKALRWRESLQSSLIDRRLSVGFDAGDRVSHEWKDSGFPSGTYASESIIAATGVLNIRFVLQRPIDDIIEVDDTDRPPVFIGSQGFPPVWHKKKIGKIITANWEKLKPFLEGVSPEEFYRDYLEGASDKDAVFHQIIGEKVARSFINSLAFSVEDETGRSIGTIPIDVSVTSRYTQNGILKVTLRLGQPTNFARDKFHYLRIKCKELNYALLGITFTINFGNVLPDGSYMTVESGFMRYKTKHFDGFLFKYQNLGDDLTATDGVTIYAGPSTEELKDPRKEDLVIVNKLIAHLNDNLEHYHKAIWLNMTPERRFMLLDGIILNGKGEGKSIASLVENDLMTIVGNSLVFPVAPGLNLNPDFGLNESLTEFYMTAAAEPISVSVPTKGVFAEAVMGKCNSCEKIEEDRFWRWEEAPIPDSPTAINPINTETRRADPGNLQPQQFPNPIVNIQNAPGAPDPTGLTATLGLLGQSNIFKDITGLEGNQRNAMQAFQSSLDAAQGFAQGAANLEVQKTMERRLDKALNAIDNDKSLTPEKKAELKEKAFNAYLGGGPIKEEATKDKQTKPTLTDAAVKAVDQGKNVKAQSTKKDGTSESVDISGQKTNTILASVEGSIPKLKQANENACWATAATIMMSWEKGKILSIEEVLTEAGAVYLQKFNNKETLKSSEKEGFISKLGMVGEAPASYPLQQYIDWVKAYGPLWITTDSSEAEGAFSPHARILTKIIGTGTPDGIGTDFIFIDPLTGTEQTEPFADFLTKYQQMVTDNPSASLFIQIVHFKDEITGEGAGAYNFKYPINGIDIYFGNLDDGNAPTFANIKNSGFSFVFHQAQGSGTDSQFLSRWPKLKTAGLLRGAYYFPKPNGNTSGNYPLAANKQIYNLTTTERSVLKTRVDNQMNAFINTLKRLLPGDFGPVLDLEDRLTFPDDNNRIANADYWVNESTRLLNWMEASLGRQPIIYSSRSWWGGYMNNAQGFERYLLWLIDIVNVDNKTTPNIPINSSWNTWNWWQWHTELNVNSPMPPPFRQLTDKGVDLDYFNGNIFELRGLADIGRPGVAMDATNSYIAHADSVDSLHIISGPTIWEEKNISLPSSSTPITGNDPVAIISAGTLYLYYRSGDTIYELEWVPGQGFNQTRFGTAWGAFHDPRAISDGNNRYVVYWGDDDDWHLHIWNGNNWQVNQGLLTQAGLKSSTFASSGQPNVYLLKGEVVTQEHIIGRAGTDGHLYDVWFDGSSWDSEDITQLSNAPATTYSSCIYETSSSIYIVFRAVGGEIWIIDRIAKTSTNLMMEVQSTLAAGHPTCFVLNDLPHIVYRGIDKFIYDLWYDGNAWQNEPICTIKAAADPVASSNGSIGLVVVRAADGKMEAAEFDGTNWKCGILDNITNAG